MIGYTIVLSVMGFSFGVLAAGGVFTVLSAVGLVPRFCQRTNTANFILQYENLIILGSILGCIISIWEVPFYIAPTLQAIAENHQLMFHIMEKGIFIVYGVFSGIFVGCLALAIAEMLDSIPIFTRRIRFKYGLSIIVFAMAIGKICGSLFYFIHNINL